MENKYCTFKFYGIYCAICAADIAFDNFKNTATAKAFQNFCCVVLLAMLRKIQSVAEEPHHLRGKSD